MSALDVRRVAVLLAVLGTPALAQVPLRTPAMFVRLEAGAVNPGSMTQVTLGFGGAIGVRAGRHVMAFEVMNQSQNRNSGDDLLGDARTFLLLTWDYLGSGHGPRQRQLFGRLGVGRLLRAPFQDAWVAEGGVGLRYRMTPSLDLLGSITDAIAFLATETYSYCPDPSGLIIPCGTYGVDGGPQHNFGFVLGLELRIPP